MRYSSEILCDDSLDEYAGALSLVFSLSACLPVRMSINLSGNTISNIV